MNVLVTGASGQLGPFVIRALQERHDLVLMSRHPPDAEFAALPWIQGDLTVYDDCRRAVQGADAIQHLAAQPWPVDHPALRKRAAAHGLAFDATIQSNLVWHYLRTLPSKLECVVMAGSNCALGHGYRISHTPFPLQALPIDEGHPLYPEDSYSYSKLAGELLLASYTRAYGIRTSVTRPAAIYAPARRQQLAHTAAPATGWDPWLWAWVGSEDVARVHRLLMEQAETLPPHDVYYLTAEDTTALEPSAALIAQFQPALLSLAEGLDRHQSFFSTRKLHQAVGWQPQTSWRDLR
jgi:nucleoside-diphosphate-sugar epimerase